MGEGHRERGRHRIRSSVHAVNTEPSEGLDAELKLTNCEVMI